MANVQSHLADKSLIMIIGPAAIGKSTIMHAATELDNRFAYVKSFTTRPDRSDGKSTYRHISEHDVATLNEQREVVTYLRHPTTGYIYGTTLESYPGAYNLLDTLSGSVGTYQALPFARTVTVSVTTDPVAWERWLLERYPTASKERTKRLQEAIMSIEWSLAQANNTFWLVNQPDNPRAVAEHLIAIALGHETAANQPAQASQLLTRAKLLLSYD